PEPHETTRSPPPARLCGAEAGRGGLGRAEAPAPRDPPRRDGDEREPEDDRAAAPRGHCDPHGDPAEPRAERPLPGRGKAHGEERLARGVGWREELTRAPHQGVTWREPGGPRPGGT